MFNSRKIHKKYKKPQISSALFLPHSRRVSAARPYEFYPAKVRQKARIRRLIPV
jgi:hypothetical protein